MLGRGINTAIYKVAACSAVEYGTVQCIAVQCCAVLISAVQCSGVNATYKISVKACG